MTNMTDLEKENWESEFDKQFNLSTFDIISSTKPIKSFIHSLLAKQRENLKLPPMGVSQWRNHGIKYHYWEFFEKKQREEIIALVEGMRKNWVGGYPSQGYQEALSDIIKALRK